MAKFNKKRAKAAPLSPIVTGRVPKGRTHEGAPGYTRNAQGELFLLAVSNMAGEDTFYESAASRDNRYAELVQKVAVHDPQWTVAFLGWLRSEGNMRSASVVGALEAAKAMLAADISGSRQLIASVLQRADEPGEALAYWMSRYGRAIPKPVKRGVADAVARLYTEYGLLKYDTASAGFRFADVIDLVHPVPAASWQGDLFKVALERRHHRDNLSIAALPMLSANTDLRAAAADNPLVLLDAQRLKAAGMTWEDVLSLAGSRLDKGKLWTALIPSMGYMACLAKTTQVWLADGTTASIEEVVSRRLSVLSYDKAWDTRPVRYGPNQGLRDHSVGDLVPTAPSAWLDMGLRPVAAIRFVSGRVIEATYDHRWVRQRQRGRHSWEWTTTADLRVGDRIPIPLTAAYFGDEGDAWDGYFVGAMLGDGGMTALTPEFHGDPNDGAVAFMREYAAKHDCGVREYRIGKIVRLRFPYKRWRRNPLTEILRHYDVWGKRVEVKVLPQRPFSREFWIGALSALIDTDGHVRERRNPKGTYHASIEYATISKRLAEQVSDALLRLGAPNTVRERPVSGKGKHPLYMVEVNRATAMARLAALLDLRISYKAATLARAAERLAHVRPAYSEMHGYDEAVALDRIVAIEDAGEQPTYCVTVDRSNLFVANGIVTGNCIRNLRNFDEAGVTDKVAAGVAARLSNASNVERSRQFPFRFLAAYEQAPSLRWGHALDQALQASLANLPELPGRTLILVDTSASMTHGGFSARSKMTPAKAAAVFGVALAAKGERVDLHGFADGVFRHTVPKGASVLKQIDGFVKRTGEVGHGTQIVASVRKTYNGQNRVVIISDMQTMDGAYGGGVSDAVPANVPIYGFNLNGYQRAAYATGSENRHEFGGLTDATFRMIPLLEAGHNARWPWL